LHLLIEAARDQRIRPKINRRGKLTHLVPAITRP